MNFSSLDLESNVINDVDMIHVDIAEDNRVLNQDVVVNQVTNNSIIAGVPAEILVEATNAVCEARLDALQARQHGQQVLSAAAAEFSQLSLGASAAMADGDSAAG